MIPLEKEIEARFCAKIKKCGGLCLKWVCPGCNGVPDRIVLLPGGTVFFAELKRPKGGRLSTLQKWWQQRLISLGFNCLVIRNQEDIAACLRKVEGAKHD